MTSRSASVSGSVFPSNRNHSGNTDEDKLSSPTNTPFSILSSASWTPGRFWVFLFIFRCLNALCVRTFFQPDEYFQSLEPAWQMAFGENSGAWITWEWHHELRSSLHPALFAVVYTVVDKLAKFWWLSPHYQGVVLAEMPNIVQACLAATGDYYTWQLSKKIYGTESSTSWVTLGMTVLSPWQWFCSTRTFSNGLETTLTIAALNFWPWALSVNANLTPGGILSIPEESFAKNRRVLASPSSHRSLRIALLLAATACILRPTNGLIWFCILMPTVVNIFSIKTRLPTSDYVVLAIEAILCGCSVLILSATSDRLYFGDWTFPPYQWLNFNVSQDLAVFYGRNDWHYYLSQGLPLLLTTYLPFAVIGLWKSTSGQGSSIGFLLANTVLVTIAALSTISHKEVRFIYPLLPLLHIITAPTMSSFFYFQSTTSSLKQDATSKSFQRKPLFAVLMALNLLIAGYTTQVHQRGVLDVMTFLRTEYEFVILNNNVKESSSNEVFVGFLMPCHSTPWRSKLIHPGLKAWALGCEPPIHLAPRTPEREAYRDEADRFYDEPLKFLKTEISTAEKPWPRYIAGFAGVESILQEYCQEELKGAEMRERWRGKNSDWHDDSRRVGDVIVWEFVQKDVPV